MSSYSDTTVTSNIGQACSVDAGASTESAIVAVKSGCASTATTAFACREFMQRSSGGVTPTSQTPAAHTTRSPASVSAFHDSWATPPTLAGNPLVFIYVGEGHLAYGAWRPPRPWAAPYLVNGEQIDLRTASNNTRTPVITHSDSLAEGSQPRSIRRRPRRKGIFSVYRHKSQREASGSSTTCGHNWQETWVSEVRSAAPAHINSLAVLLASGDTLPPTVGFALSGR